MGRRLAASARRGRNARCRTAVRVVPTMDAGPGNTVPHPGDQSGKALWISELKARNKMSVNNKRVFYVKYLAHEIYADILRARPDVRLDRLENESAEEISAPILAAAHAYQIGAARDELADRLEQRRRLRSRRCRGLHGGGCAGRQSIRRQCALGGRTRIGNAAH